MKEIPGLSDSAIRKIAGKVINDERISPEEGVLLFSGAELSLLGFLADTVRKRKNGNVVYYIRNFHIEPTNRCIYNCRFCSYRRPAGHPESWDYDQDEMLDIVRRFDKEAVAEVHIVGGVHPDHDLHFYGTLIQKIKKLRPGLHVKAFSAIELDFMIRKAGLSIAEGLKKLKEYGLNSIPGGGAEIFDEEIRKEISPDKTSSEMWLNIHETAHKLGIPSNATMLYGHIETYTNRINHLNRLRELQDRTGGFNAFIPLKYRKVNNQLSQAGEVSLIEDLRNYAVSRIFLDNIPHIKAYWPMAGKTTAQLSLLFGADDLDGTISDTTRIYSMAGSEDTAMTTGELRKLISDAGFTPVERDSLYNPVK
ncbi:MAG: aminofutalosine synthase MqnE [Bacteroidales bacterium]|nr:aminofutalosine synthase MqnE [Bacteroidales bacterium]